MLKFPIDTIRQVIEQTLEREHLKDNHFFGGKNQVNLFSFYEQLEKEEQVDRYREFYKDLVDEQNRTGLIMNGTIIAPENPTITNLNQCLIIPMTFTCSFRVRIEDRDDAIDTINNMISILKGRKQDIAIFDNGVPFMVGTLANNVNGVPAIQDGDFIYSGDLDPDEFLATFFTNWNTTYGYQVDLTKDHYYYYEDTTNRQLNIAYYGVVGGNADAYHFKTLEEFNLLIEQGYIDSKNCVIPVFIPKHKSFEKYKLSMSFDSIRIDEPRTLNGGEYVVVSFGGSATLVSASVKLGNDLTKLAFSKHKIVGEQTITIDSNKEWLEPLEMPSGNNANTQLNQLLSNKFINNTHTDSVNISTQYTFMVDESVDLISEWFDYARYGIQANLTTIATTKKGITPNMIYKITELWSSWGVVRQKEFKAKVIESIDIENTESDTLTITIPLQVQGDNN